MDRMRDNSKFRPGQIHIRALINRDRVNGKTKSNIGNNSKRNRMSKLFVNQNNRRRDIERGQAKKEEAE